MSRLNVANFRHPDGTDDNINLNSSGQVGIGTTSLDAHAPLTIQGGTGANATIRLNGGASDDNARIESKYHLYLMCNGDGNQSGRAVIFGNNSTEQGRFDSSGNLRFNSGYGSVQTAYGVRAWVNFNGQNTLSIYEDGGVTSITDNGTGDYTVNFAFTMPDNDYTLTGSASFCALSSNGNHSVEFKTGTARNTGKTTTSARIEVTYVNSGTNRAVYDYDEISAVFIR